MSDKIRVLQIGLDSHLGGIETYLLKIATNLDKEKYNFSFLAYKGSQPCFQKELEELGCAFYFITPRKKNYHKYISELNHLISENDFDIMHCNLNSLSNFEPILLGIKNKKGVLVHSRNASNMSLTVTRILNWVGQKTLPQKKVTCAAVSDLAGKWMFGEKSSFTVLNNGLDVKKYKYDENARRQIREELNLREKEVILHVGAFRKQKNHRKVIEIFRAYRAKYNNAVLLLVGEGDLRKDIESLVSKYKLDTSVIFTGNRDDVPKLLSAGDKFLLPSFYEGFPNVLIEAETSGLYCVVADSITQQAIIANLSQYVPLDASVDIWVKALEKSHNYNRSECSDLVREAGLDIESEMNRLYTIYNRCMKKM